MDERRFACNRQLSVRSSEGFVNVRTVGDRRRHVKGSRKMTVAKKPSEHLHPKAWRSIREQVGW